MTVLSPLTIVNFLFKHAVKTMFLIRILCKVISAEWNHFIQDMVSQLEHGDLYGIHRLYTQNESCTVAMLFYELSEVVFSLKVRISYSVYVTNDTTASSAAELCLAAFDPLFPRQFACPSRYVFRVFLVIGRVSGFLYLVSLRKRLVLGFGSANCGNYFEPDKKVTFLFFSSCPPVNDHANSSFQESQPRLGSQSGCGNTVLCDSSNLAI